MKLNKFFVAAGLSVLLASITGPAISYAATADSGTIHDKASLDSYITDSNQSQGYTVQVSMVDLLGKPFFSGFDLVDATGKHYERSWIYDNIYTGTCSFTNIPAGIYKVEFYYSTYHPITQYIVVLKDEKVRVQLATPTYTITGRALDSNLQPLAYDQVLLVDPRNIGGYWPLISSDGTFKMWGIPDGSYTVEVSSGWDNYTPIVLISEPVTVSHGNLDLGTLVEPAS